MFFQKDYLKTINGSEIILTFYAHASVGIEWNGTHIYVDPVGEKYGINYSSEPKADMILVTHHHADHLDINAINILSKEDTKVYASKRCLQVVSTEPLAPYDSITYKGVSIYAVPAYNISEGHIHYHPKEDEGLGYVLNIGGTNLYIAGDTEDNYEVLSLKDVDIAFLPVNQPYTMTIDQVINIINNIHPSILYPYHTGSQIGETDVEPLVDKLKGICEVRIRNMK